MYEISFHNNLKFFINHRKVSLKFLININIQRVFLNLVHKLFNKLIKLYFESITNSLNTTHYNKIMSEESKYINPNFSQSICFFCNQRGEKWTLSSHINESKDTFSGGDARLMAHKEDTKEGQEWKCNLVYHGLYEIVYEDTAYSMKGRKIALPKESEKYQPRLSEKESTLWKFKGRKDKDNGLYYVKIQNCFTGEYMYINYEDKRDDYSYYIYMTPDETKATEFTVNKK